MRPLTRFALVVVTAWIAAILLALAPQVANASILYEDEEGDVVRVTGQPCPPEVLRHITQGERGHYSFAFTKLGGVRALACATLVTLKSDPEVPRVHVVMETGDNWVIRLDAFKPAPAI